MPEQVLVAEMEIITDGDRRRRRFSSEKIRIVEGKEDQDRPRWGVSLTNLEEGHQHLDRCPPESPGRS